MSSLQVDVAGSGWAFVQDLISQDSLPFAQILFQLDLSWMNSTSVHTLQKLKERGFRVFTHEVFTYNPPSSITFLGNSPKNLSITRSMASTTVVEIGFINTNVPFPSKTQNNNNAPTPQPLRYNGVIYILSQHERMPR